MYLIENKFIYSTTRKEYYQFDLVNRNVNQISIEKYCELVFGKYNYKLRNLLGYSNSIASDKIYSTFYQNFDLLIHNRDGELVVQKKGFFKGFTPYEIQVNESRNEIWVATGGGQVVICKDIDSERTTFQLGTSYEDKSELSFPESINIYENALYISEMGNKRILKFDMNNKKQSEYISFEEPVWDFQKNKFAEIVHLDSGVYELKDGRKRKISIEN